jgi:hypothetical protein
MVLESCFHPARRAGGYSTGVFYKKMKESGIIKALFDSMEANAQGAYLNPRPGPNSPDFVAEDLKHNPVAVELTELVSQEAIEANLKGHEIYRDWRPSEVINRIEEILKEKGAKSYHGGPYSKIILVIHTDELVISSREYIPILKNHIFGPLKQIDEVYFIFSYESNSKEFPTGYPYLRLSTKR